MATGDLTAEVVEEVAVNLEEAAVAVRRFDTKSIGFLVGGICIGVGIGFFFGYRYNREKLRAEAFRQSEEEVEKIREVYREGRVLETSKPGLEEVVEERGYSTPGDVEFAPEMQPRPLPPPVPIHESVEPPPPLTDAQSDHKDKNTGWSFPYELSQRSPNTPFIIHQDEYFSEEAGYQHVQYTYYAKDDVLADEDDTVLHNRHNLIGPDKHLTRFGHGADDHNVLYVRNSHLELDIEITREPRAYEEEVQGLEDETRSSRDDSEPA